jgi:type I restriction-modification system DNA methylase subunit
MHAHEYKPEVFIKKLEKIDRSKSNRDKFRDFMEMAYCAYAKLTAPNPERANELEERYMRVVGTYRDKDDVRKYPELLEMVGEGVKDNRDYLGEVAGLMETLNPEQGQFFTPMSVSKALAMMTLGDLRPQVEAQSYVSIAEPAAGAGGILLAAAEVFRQQELNPNIHMFAHAVDVSNLAYQMCFLQLSMAGVAAYVERANSLSLEHFEGAWTLAAVHNFRPYHWHLHFDRPERNEAEQAEEAVMGEPLEDAPPKLKQLSMF